MKSKTTKLVQYSIMSAIIIVFHILATYTSNVLATSINLVLVPIAIGSICFGYKGALVLSAISGLTTILMGWVQFDKFTGALLLAQPIETILICMVKIMAAAVVCSFLYNTISKKNDKLACLIASISIPVVNTGLFIVGGLTIVSKTLTANYVSDGMSLVYFVVVGCALINFIAEFCINLVLSPTINRLSKLIRKYYNH